MEATIFVLVFFAALGVLLLLYALHFRRRALTMGAERLRSALSRAMEGEEAHSPEDLQEAARELDARFGRAALILWALLVMDLAACLLLTFLSSLSRLALALCGPAVFLLSSALSLEFLRELPRSLLEEGRGEDA